MNDYQIFFFLLGAIAGLLVAVCVYLRRILNILKKIGNGEPTNRELREIELRNIKLK